MRIIGIIPARYNSSRLPGKPLADIGGKSMIMRVYEQATKANLAEVMVATDDIRILDHLSNEGASVVMTSTEHVSGTDRVLEAALQCETTPQAIINIQGDEPFIDPNSIQKLSELLGKADVEICTLIKKFDPHSDLTNPNRVKVEIDNEGRALSFSRKVQNSEVEQFQHLGLYGYKFPTLKKICALESSPSELKEKLEQLRWHDAGIPIHTALVKENSICVDTPEDLELANELVKRY